jgi:hypothetical protein
VGADRNGIKDFVANQDGCRESEQNWVEALNLLKKRRLEIGPELDVGDEALDFLKCVVQGLREETRSEVLGS